VDQRTRGESQAPRLPSIQGAPLFNGLTLAEQSEVAGAAFVRRVLRREPICREGEPEREVTLLCAGRAKSTQTTAGGESVILRLAGPGEVLCGLGPAAGALHPSTNAALEPCDVLVWDTRTFEAFADRFPSLRRNALRIVAERLRFLEERYRELATEKVPARLARTLLRLLGQIGRPHRGAVLIGMSREDLAQMTGTTLFTVSRLLSHWQSMGFLEAVREAVIVGEPRYLARIAEGSICDEAESLSMRKDVFPRRA
jgi:CRP-like cAMP-binding protein